MIYFPLKTCEHGGDPYTALEYIKDRGIETEESYSYEAISLGQCRYDQNKIAVRVQNGRRIPWGNEDALKAAVAKVKNVEVDIVGSEHSDCIQGPVSVAIDATDSLQFYSNGIVSTSSCDARVTRGTQSKKDKC